jgi:hypothetical protein
MTLKLMLTPVGYSWDSAVLYFTALSLGMGGGGGGILSKGPVAFCLSDGLTQATWLLWTGSSCP